jgi:hypothetical protein
VRRSSYAQPYSRKETPPVLTRTNSNTTNSTNNNNTNNSNNTNSNTDATSTRDAESISEVGGDRSELEKSVTSPSKKV